MDVRKGKYYGKYGKNHHNWTGGRLKNSYGYIHVLKRGNPMANRHGYILEHRFVMSDHLGRKLDASEHVHHINGIKDDNRIENLQLISPSAHMSLHKKGVKYSKRYMPCDVCGHEFYSAKTRLGYSRYCSAECHAVTQRGKRRKQIPIQECPQCHRTFKPRFVSYKMTFCSLKCSLKSREKDKRKTCHYCGKEFVTKKTCYSRPQRFCSVSCGSKNRGKK